MTLERALVLVLAAVWLSYAVRDVIRRRLTRRLVTFLHARGHHEAAHEVRWALLPGVQPTKEELDMERRDRR